MRQLDDQPLRIDDRLLAETQGRINAVFQDDLLFPVYVIPAEKPYPDCIMTVSGGASSHYYRDKIIGWQGSGFVIQTHKAELLLAKFHGSFLHEIVHCFQSDMSPPWSCLPEAMGLPSFPKERPRPAFPSAHQTYLAHRPDFWRLAVHVWTRGVDAFPCRFSDLCMTWVEPDDMLAVLASEIEQLRHLSLWKVALRPVPRGFATLFDFDPFTWDKFDCPATIILKEKNAS